jgi:N-methylhydantoinase B
VAALRTGERRLMEIYQKFGSATVDTAVERVISLARDRTTEVVRGLPQGSWTAVDWLDDDGISDDPIRMQVTVTIENGVFTCDFRGSAPATRGPVNMPLGATIACARVAFKAFTTPDEQTNAGHFEPLRVVTEPGSLFHAVYPAATFTQWTGNLAVELIYKALAQADPQRVAACSGGDVPGYMMVGEHPETGELFAISNNDLVGWGATASHDGHGPANHICQTAGRCTPVEVLEAKSGMVVERLEIRCDSAGAGRHRGGPGLRRDIRFRCDGEFLSVVKRTRSAPWALDGGQEPDPISILLFPGTAHERAVSTRRTRVVAGDRVSILTAGGGGHGDPKSRDPQQVRRDVAEGYVSVTAARSRYGVEVVHGYDD